VRDLTPLADLRVALIQTRLAWHNPAANRAHFADLPTCRLADLLSQAQSAGLIVVPEIFTIGFSMYCSELA
jgi:omega-amidase